MRNLLIFAGIAGLAAAVAIYFVSENSFSADEDDYITDTDIDLYDQRENTGEAVSTDRGFHAMS